MTISDVLSRRQIPFCKVSLVGKPEIGEATRQLVARTELVRTDDGYLIVIIPADYTVDYSLLEVLMGVRPILPARPQDFVKLFGDGGDGFAPPLGSVYGIRTVVDIHLACCETLVFAGDDPEDAISLRFEDFERIEAPITGRIAERR